VDKNIKALKRVEYMQGALIILAGLLMSVFSFLLAQFISVSIGTLIILLGVFLISNSLFEKCYESSVTFRLIMGFVLLALGMAFFINPEILMSVISIIIGLIVLFVGIVKLINSIDLARNGKISIWNFTEAVLNLLFGLFMLFHTVRGSQLILIIIGVYLVYFGIFYMIAVYRSKAYVIK
jgi:uncharacterized membrane protein HdeD (DUF308 family)